MKFVEPYLKPIFQREETESLLIPIEDVNQIVDEDGHSIAAQSEEDIESVVSDNISESIPQTLKKRKIKVESESNEERQMFSDWLPNETINQEDPRRMFLLSLLPDINKLTDTQMLHFKLKVNERLRRPRRAQRKADGARAEQRAPAIRADSSALNLISANCHRLHGTSQHRFALLYGYPEIT
ncbi:hypothetical protein EVAR_94798_1 [Eumeta japonica]|uniref:BESS domain-containing protein n=1 Tax=Eumeta variegata TaxID=151549 RepID=A0A4C1UI15_EUMVA|nr:hypothetical protein EVAR_94798_1 [Eumeta japonica]